MTFKVGDHVTWKSQSHGSHTIKHGIVLVVVPRDVHPEKLVPDGFDEPQRGYGWAREHESYLVKVGNKKVLYWPRVKQLKPDSEQNQS